MSAGETTRNAGTPLPPRSGARSTRLLLSIAAIAVACGLLNIPNAYLFNTLAVAAPAFLGAAAGAYYLPAALAQLAFRRGGVGLLAQLLAGLVQAPFVPGGFGSVAAYLFIGLLVEIPFAVAGWYRYWRPWLHLVTAVFTAVVYTLFWAASGFYDPATAPLWFAVAVPAVLIAALVVATLVAFAVIAGVDRTGVLRGLRGPEIRPRRTRGRGPATTAAPAASDHPTV